MERAGYVVEHGYCEPQDVDAAMEYGFNYKMGPFRTQDITGFHITYGNMKKQYEETGKKPDMYDYYTRMIQEGRLGKASTITTKNTANNIPAPRAVHHSDKLPIKGVNFRHCALKMLEIHKVFLRFLPSLAEISTLYRCYAVLKW